MISASSNELAVQLKSHFPHAPTLGQERLIHAFSKFLISKKPRCTLIIKGYAGTGKTTSIGAIVRTLKAQKVPTVLLAPTGRAAKVMASYSGINASIIHRRIYVGKKNSDGSDGYKLAPNHYKKTTFIVAVGLFFGRQLVTLFLGEGTKACGLVVRDPALRASVRSRDRRKGSQRHRGR